MKKFLFLFLFSFASLYAQEYYTFSELKGRENNSGETNLFYRLYNYTYVSSWDYDIYNSIYNLNVDAGSDTFYLPDFFNRYTPNWVDGISTHNFDLFDEDPGKYIYCYTSGFSRDTPELSPTTTVARYDNAGAYHNISLYANVGISKQDDSLVYGSNGNFVKSTDGGRNWLELPIQISFLALSPFDDQVFFGQNYDGELYKSTDGGESISIVDTTNSYIYFGSYEGSGYNANQFEFDTDSIHIYRVYQKTNQYYFSVSVNKGEQFSWSVKRTSGNKIFISTDYSQTGSVYLADGKYIYHSMNYGETFNEYKILDRKIVGIYKKPDSEKLYAATKYDIYEMTPDSISVIKHLEPDPGLADYYPLVQGNKWVYREITCLDDPFVECDTSINIVEITGDTILSNGHKYFIVEGLDTYERFDSSDATIRRYGEDTLFTNHEYIIENLSAEVGDTLCTNRFFPYTFNCEAPKIFERETTVNLFGNNYPKKVYQLQYVFWINYSLVKGIGIDSMFTAFDFGYTSSELLGCVIDGVLYGDTTTVGVDDEPANIISQFVLYQNYPNPFNPVTTIKYSVGSRQLATIKVYDVLGREVATLVNEEKLPGVYEVEFNPVSGIRNLASGVYYYQLKAGNFIETKKMIYLK